MQPSSLIFVLVVAIWAVYLLQYWIKRRDHLSTVRSVDRFSAAMRVLDDHRMGRGAAEPTPRSYSVAPTRAARPEVTVKHAEATPARAEQVGGAPRRLRGLTLLAMITLVPVAAVAAVLGPLPWWTIGVPLAGAVVAFVWLRRSVVAERAAARRVRVEPRRDTAPRAERPVAPPAERPVAPNRPAAPARTAPPLAAPAARSTRVYDVAQDQAPDQEVVVEPVATVAEPEPGTWQPTPVPRPMYTMKAKAERPEPAPVPASPAPAPAGDVPQVIEVEDEDLPAIAGWA
ncbi:hypothetical protein [Janibacter sp. DB-40]|uniref:hypothetical protein n=1 Tax=Janibacter sp. DB-40 TaxID=3028808 RepID=UPI002406258D|nr:hypothetical protein [Janibacter sp. DB-40]